MKIGGNLKSIDFKSTYIKYDLLSKHLRSKLITCFDQKNKIITFFMLGLLLVGYTYIKSTPSVTNKDNFQIDSIIPTGYVLIPIKLLNSQAISSVIGSHGVADIYATIDGEKSKKLFSKSKIIKSVDTEDVIFSVLVKEAKAYLLTGSDTPFFAAVQNPKAHNTDVESKHSPEIKIIYQN